MKVAIVVSGGNVQQVVADCEDVDIEVFDFDNEPDGEPPSPDTYCFEIVCR